MLFPSQGLDKDVVYTPEPVALDMIDYFKPNGRILDPCKGGGVFLDNLPDGSEWCEITEGKDFLRFNDKIDWIIGNPPYSMFAKWIYHSMSLADNFVYLVPCDKPFISDKMLRTLSEWGGMVHMRVYGPGNRFGFPIGFAVGAIHFQRAYTGGLTFSRWAPKAPNVQPNKALQPTAYSACRASGGG